MNQNTIQTQSQNVSSSENGEGYLEVKVSTAKEAIPLGNARVTVYDNENNNAILYSITTDSAGLTERVKIKTVSASASQAPSEGKPYKTVNVEVLASGYTPVHFLNLPIFDNILSVQRANMVPISESGSNLVYDFNEISNYPVFPNNL